ncbi:hypothetical protein K7A41_07685 [Sphingobacterium sp. InxBP1]|uniref:hypothetical protein n=1 Tax=Sphingobacterium sp. InxBP1 TaxID=2870328 RepID=UPI00224478C2|nr:hypothetical protein [Sphingobacterium sp. InxBP1]MCW8311099.1 hypothetical protein [Sphingobacterium sp. InxBP1]
MKQKIIATLLAFAPAITFGQSADPNIEISLSEPAFGVNIKTNFPGGNGIWARGYRVSNQTGAENFIQFGTFGNTTNGVAKAGYSFIGKGYDQTYLTFLPDGNVGIGTISPKEKLSVNGKIRAQEVKVEVANWPDFVFEEEYKLNSLQEIKEFIRANKHLPNVPKASEVNVNGVDLGEMNKILLQKIEELTLHMISLQEELETLRLKR